MSTEKRRLHVRLGGESYEWLEAAYRVKRAEMEAVNRKEGRRVYRSLSFSLFMEWVIDYFRSETDQGRRISRIMEGLRREELERMRRERVERMQECVGVGDDGLDESEWA